MVDGAPRRGTVLCLSHWPGTPTPEDLRADLSAEIALAVAERPDRVPAGVSAVSVDHYDEDGLVSLALLCLPGLAEAHGLRLVEVARIGDFGVVRDEAALPVALALGALADPARSPLPAVAAPDRPDRLAVTAAATAAGLARLPDLLAAPGDHVGLWGPELAAVDASRRALDAGAATLEEHPELDLAVVRVGRVPPEAAWGGQRLHPVAVHSATDRMRVATVAGGSVEVAYRYETWVRTVSRRLAPRVDLGPLADELSRAEPAGVRWRFGGVRALRPRLAAEAASGLHPDHVLERLAAHLAAAGAPVR